MVGTARPFAAINTAGASGGIYPEPGIYEVEVVACKGVQGHKGTSFVAELLIHTSTNPERPVGTAMSWVCNLKHASALGNIRGFVAAATEAKFEEIEEAHVNAVISPANPLKGTRLRLQAVQVPTRAGGKFTKCAWTFVRAAE